jgi:protein-disulfide isomerase
MVSPEPAARPSAPRVEHVLGSPLAPVTVTEYGDYECPYCAGAAPILRELVERSAGGVRLVFRNFPLFGPARAGGPGRPTPGGGPPPGEEAFWAMHAKLFHHQARLGDVDLQLYAEASGGDPQLAVGASAQQFASIVEADYAEGLSRGVSGTPSLFIGDVAYDGRIDLQSLQRATSGSQPAEADRRGRPWQRR